MILRCSTVLTCCLAATFALFLRLATAAEAPSDAIAPGSWSLAILPDTQHAARNWPEYFTAQTQWIKDHHSSHNIQYVLHVGDIVNNNNTTQWNRAKTSMNVLNGSVPYALATGNHDYGPDGKTENRDTLFNSTTYFGAGSAYANQSSVGGFFEAGKTDNSYHTFRVNNQDWLILSLEFGPRDNVVDWAKSIVSQYPNHEAILLTHAYMYNDDTRYDWAAKGTMQSWSPYSYGVAGLAGGVNDAQQLWDQLVSKHDNFRLVFSGHVLADGTGYLASTTPHGNTVHQMLSNYQFLDHGGEGYLRYLEFSPQGDSTNVIVRTYSPFLGHDRATDQQFSFTIHHVPEPSSIYLLAIASLAGWTLLWRKSR